MPSLGTRSTSRTRQEFIDTRSETRTHQQDLGLTKLVTASVTFVSSSTNQLRAANGTFANFAVGDDILVEGSNASNGRYHVDAIDATNQSFLTVDGCRNEGPVTVTIRTL